MVNIYRAALSRGKYPPLATYIEYGLMYTSFDILVYTLAGLVYTETVR